MLPEEGWCFRSHYDYTMKMSVLKLFNNKVDCIPSKEHLE